MSLESMAVKTTQDVVSRTVNLVDSTMKKIWSILDAATEKESPSKYLSPRGISSIQGQDS